MYIQSYDYTENCWNELLRGFRKAYSTQHALFRLIQLTKQIIDQSVYYLYYQRSLKN